MRLKDNCQISIMIYLQDALRLMHKRDEDDNLAPFSIQACTADRKLNTGGKLENFKNVIITWSDDKAGRAESKRIKHPTKQKSGRPPRHFKNRTRNIQFSNGQVRKIHISLITEFNGEVVV